MTANTATAIATATLEDDLRRFRRACRSWCSMSSVTGSLRLSVFALLHDLRRASKPHRRYHPWSNDLGHAGATPHGLIGIRPAPRKIPAPLKQRHGLATVP